MKIIKQFKELISNYTNDPYRIAKLSEEVIRNYREEGRYYHNIKHLESLLSSLECIKNDIQDWEAMLFALVYHDYIYDSMSKENEEQSAMLALQRMEEIYVPEHIQQRCYQIIIATKTHTLSAIHDINLFTDADIAVLGSDWNAYENYAKAIRQEYAIIPKDKYREGRKKVLQHFLAMEVIYKTEYFKTMYEARARENIQREIELLST